MTVTEHKQLKAAGVRWVPQGVAADLLGVSATRVKELRRKKKIAWRVLMGEIAYDMDDLERRLGLHD